MWKACPVRSEARMNQEKNSPVSGDIEKIEGEAKRVRLRKNVLKALVWARYLLPFATALAVRAAL